MCVSVDYLKTINVCNYQPEHKKYASSVEKSLKDTPLAPVKFKRLAVMHAVSQLTS